MNIRWWLFSAYVVCLVATPLAILAGMQGAIVGLGLSVGFLVLIRWQGTERLSHELKLIPLPQDERPEVHHMIAEYCRRLSVPTPRVMVMPSPAINLAILGFTSHEAVLVLTRGALQLPRPQVSALLARQLCGLWHGDYVLETWLSRYLSFLSVGEEGAPRKKYYSTRHFLKHLLLYPLTLPPSYLLSKPRNDERLDLEAAKLSQNPRALSEALRTMEANRERVMLKAPVHTLFLFLVSPAAHDSLFHLFSESDGKGRIRAIESLTRLVGAVE